MELGFEPRGQYSEGKRHGEQQAEQESEPSLDNYAKQRLFATLENKRNHGRQ